MSKRMTGPMLDRVGARKVFLLYWHGLSGKFIINSGVGNDALTPDELADLSRELLRTAVTKGDE